jgi:TonB family protein
MQNFKNEVVYDAEKSEAYCYFEPLIAKVESPKKVEILFRPPTILSCGELRIINKEDSSFLRRDSIRKLFKIPELFSINNDRDTIITCQEGTTLIIPSNSFVSAETGNPISGKLTISVREYYNLSDILLDKLTTTSDTSLLETAGMFHIEAVSNYGNCKLRDDKKIEISFPGNNKKDDMQIFSGDWRGGILNWKSMANSPSLTKIYSNVDVLPQFPGGDQGLALFISSNLKYPARAKEFEIEGIAYIRFTIAKDGNVKDVFVLKGFDPECDKEALKAVRGLPKFIPGKVNGTNVSVDHTLPIVFRLTSLGLNEVSNQRSFGKIFSDSTINSPNSFSTFNYVFSIFKLGWINCDRFLNGKGEKIDFKVKLYNYGESDVKIVFHRFKCVVPSFSSGENHVFHAVPKGEKITILAFKNIDNKPMLAIKETIVSELIEKDLIFNPITMEELKNEMKKFDGLN